MNPQFQMRYPKRSCGRLLGFLLALPLTSIALQLPPAQAQPAPTLPAKKNLKPLSPEQKAATDKVMAIALQKNICKSLLDLKVDNATLEDVTSRVKAMLSTQTVSIEVRGASPVRVSFDLKGARVGNVLEHVAALAGCKLFVLSSGLLIAPDSLLSKAESLDVKQTRGGEWAKSTNAGGAGWSNQMAALDLFTKAIAQEVTESDAKPFSAKVVKTTFGTFSPESQAMLQQLATGIREGNRSVNPHAAPFHLVADSPISVDTSDPTAIEISFDSGTSNDVGSMGIKVNLR